MSKSPVRLDMNAIRRPSGDHTGLRSAEDPPTSVVRPDPQGSIASMSRLPPVFDVNASSPLPPGTTASARPPTTAGRRIISASAARRALRMPAPPALCELGRYSHASLAWQPTQFGKSGGGRNRTDVLQLLDGSSPSAAGGV